MIMTMVLVDTSVWVAHFRKSNASFESLLVNDQILCHPLVLIELACGSPPAPRSKTLSYIKKLQQATVATTSETLEFIEKHQLQESGCGAIDISLLASTLLSENAQLWTLDKSLDKLAIQLGISYGNKLH
jgi:predicted nucleic acid-binding protein